MMRILAGILILVSTLFPSSRQVSEKADCKLQELAIDAALGDPEAQYNLGVEFHRGDAIAQDFSKAAKMWKLASDAGIIEAYNNLGFLTYNGKGVKQDYAEGARLWRVAAERGFVESQVHLGFAYADKKFKEDYVEAYAWAKTAMHYAAQTNDEEMLRRAKNLASQSAKKLSDIQARQAEKKSSIYIRRFGPK
jgi:TPR repeat protein